MLNLKVNIVRVCRIRWYGLISYNSEDFRATAKSMLSSEPRYHEATFRADCCERNITFAGTSNKNWHRRQRSACINNNPRAGERPGKRAKLWCHPCLSVLNRGTMISAILANSTPKQLRDVLARLPRRLSKKRNTYIRMYVYMYRRQHCRLSRKVSSYGTEVKQIYGNETVAK